MDAWNTRPKPWLFTLIGGVPSDRVSDATVPTTCARTLACFRLTPGLFNTPQRAQPARLHAFKLAPGLQTCMRPHAALLVCTIRDQTSTRLELHGLRP